VDIGEFRIEFGKVIPV